jgi:sucrose-6-phosphate hydrolase SacC (GH32 family)
MVNPIYVNEIPTAVHGEYLGQMTLPRALTLIDTSQDENCQQKFRLKSSLPSEFDVLRVPGQYFEDSAQQEIQPNGVYKLSEGFQFYKTLLEVNLRFDIGGLKGTSALSICFINTGGEELCTGFDHMKEPAKKLFLNRERTGDNDAISTFFTGRLTAGREVETSQITFRIVLDVSAIEVFVDGGLTVFTTLFYPNEVLDRVEVRHHAGSPDSRLLMTYASLHGLKSIYDC